MQLREATLHDIPQLLQLEQAVIEAERPFNRHIKASGVKYYDLEALILKPSAILLVMDGNDGELAVSREDKSSCTDIIATGYARVDDSRQPFVHQQHGYLGFMYVSPEHRGQGVNQTVIAALSDWCREQQLKTVYLDVYAANQGAIRAYEKAGFVPNMIEMKMDL